MKAESGQEASGKHVVRARGWWKRGDVAACTAGYKMECWTHKEASVNREEAFKRIKVPDGYQYLTTKIKNAIKLSTFKLYGYIEVEKSTKEDSRQTVNISMFNLHKLVDQTLEIM